MSNKLERLHQIDGLRAVAIILVVFHHSMNGPLIALLNMHGYYLIGEFSRSFFSSGVELFFVISGVVLLRPYLRGEKIFNNRKYVIRRLQRIWPPYIVALLISGVVAFIVTSYPTWFSKSIPMRFSLYKWIKQIFIINIGATYNGAWWSLNLEIIFYILIPLIIPIVLMVNKKKLNMAIMLIILLIMSEIAHYYIKVNRGIIVDTVQLIALFIIYLPCFFSGIILASYNISYRMGYFLSMVGLIYLSIALPLSLSINNAFGLLYFGLVLVSFKEQGITNKILKSNLFVWIGERSYSIFLVHFVIYCLTDYIISLFVIKKDIVYFLLTRLIGIPASILISMMLFYYVERYFARGLVTGNYFWYHQYNIK
jgi:peptidoglycan/LPS O-acetylase OafA/YrhL